MSLNRTEYREECAKRWHGPALTDARGNWLRWMEVEPALREAMLAYHRNPQMEDLVGKSHNPSGTLTDALWKLQSALQPDGHRLDPLLDFEEHFQKIFLRRGLIIFCTMILREIETPVSSDTPDLFTGEKAQISVDPGTPGVVET